MVQPAKIGKYEVLSELGHGGMGVVYKALDRQLDRLVAIKMIIGATPGLLKRFNVEARSTGRLQHPNIVTIYDFGEQDGSPYLVMEFLEGASLDAVIRSGKSLSLLTKLNICVEICNGLHYAHERGIIHRDIKPGNVMVLDGGGIKIVDFGIARIGDTGISRTEVVGSLNFMSPEQFRGEALDRRVDVWSTGVLFYQLLTGALPFLAADDAAIMYKILHNDPPPLGTYLQNYPPELDQIVSKALSKNRDVRYFTTHDFAFDILAILNEQKHVEVAQWLRRAETAVEKTEWSKAEDYLKQILRIDKNHTQAHQLLSRVQIQIRTLRQVEQAKQLRMQADAAVLERRYEDALTLIEQAISLDKTNRDLANFRELVQEAKLKAAEFRAAFRQAEEAHQAGDLDEAKLAVQRARAIDPQETSAKALQAAILRDAKEYEQKKSVRALLDRGRDQIAKRDLTGALSTLKQAEAIEPESAELFSLLKVVQAAREEQVRKTDTEDLARQIEDCLSREDYTGAVSIANEGLHRYPQDKGLLQFKSLAETQQRRAQLKSYAREQFGAARKLLDDGQNQDALLLIERALKNVPSDFELDTLRTLAKRRLGTEQKDERKRQGMRQVEELVAAEKLEDALLILDTLRREFPEADDVQTLNRVVNAAHERREAAARETRRQVEEANAVRLQHLAELDGLTRSIQAEPDTSKLEQLTRRIGDLKGKYLEDSEVQTSLSHATQVLDARMAVLRRTRIPSFQPMAPASGSAEAAIRRGPPVGVQELESSPVAATTSLGRLSRSRMAVIATVAVGVIVVGAAVLRGVLSRASTSEVRIVTIPTGATVTVGDQTCSNPACELQLQAGDYTAKAHLDGYQPFSQPFTVARGQKDSTVTLTLQPLVPVPEPTKEPEVASESGATIETTSAANAKSVTGNARGATEPAATAERGTLRITARLAGGNSGSTALPGADVLVDGKYSGETGNNGSVSVPLQPRQYTVTVRKKGLLPTNEQRVDVRSTERSDVEFVLQPGIVPTTQVTQASETKIANTPETSVANNTSPPAAAAQKTSPAPAQSPPSAQKPTPVPVQIAAAPAPPVNSEETEWAALRDNSDIQKLQAYLEKYPTGRFSAEARNRVSVLTAKSMEAKQQDSIQRLLDSYSQAFESRDREQLRHVWPTISDKKFKEMQGVFKDAESIKMALKQSASPQLSGDAGTVSCLQTTEIKPKSGEVQLDSRTAIFHIRKLGNTGSGDWVIEQVDYGKVNR